MEDILIRAHDFAEKAHEGQIRKYTGEPYITHPVAVAMLVADVDGDDEMIAAALLHDTVEDTDVTIEEIKAEFGNNIAELVDDLTDVSKLEDGNRAIRKELDRIHLSKASPRAMTIKLADIIHNSGTIIPFGGKFLKIYLKEKEALLASLKDGNGSLWIIAMKILEDAKGQVI